MLTETHPSRPPRRARRGRAILLFLPALVLVLASTAPAQTGSELALKPFEAKLALDGSGDVFAYDRGRDNKSGESLRLFIVESDGRFRLKPGDVASPRFGYDFTYINVDTHVPGIPRQLFDQSIGIATPIGIYENWIFGVSLGIGYAGPTPFGDGDAWYGLASIAVFKKFNEKTALAVGIDYNGNRTYAPDIPLPGFAYIAQLSPELELTVGLPITAINWQPMERVRVQVSYELVDNIEARVGYEFVKGVEAFLLLARRSEGFFIDGLSSGNERLLFEQRRAELGLTWRTRDSGVGEQDLEFTAAIGYAWSGEFSTGFDQRDSDLLADVTDEPYVRLGLQLRF
jgi:hypothetical protein